MPMHALQTVKNQRTPCLSDQYRDPKRVRQPGDKFAPAERIIANTFLTKRQKGGVGKGGGPRQTFTIPAFLSQHMVQQ